LYRMLDSTRGGPTCFWWRRVNLFLLFLLALPSFPASAAELHVQAAVSTRRPYLGDPVVLQIVVEQSVEKAPELDTGTLESLGARQLGQPSFGHSRTIINGVSSEKFTYQYQFQLNPANVGQFTIPAVTVRQGKETAVTTPLEIHVVGPEAQDFARVELTASDESLYPGQQAKLTVGVLLRRLIHKGEVLDADPFSGRDPPKLKISWIEGTDILKPSPSLGVPPRFLKGTLEQRAQEDGPSFLINDLFVRTSISLFEPRTTQAAVRLDREAVERVGQDGAKHAYYRYSLPLDYRAAHAGSVGPLTVQVRGQIFSAVSRGARGLEADAREIFAVSEPLTLNVLAVPKAGQPETFTGGVGVFKASATAQPTKVHVGDPITLSVRVSGTGNLEEIGPPNLSAQEKWNRDFKVYDDTSPGRFEDNAKVFTISVRPKTAGVNELPSIRLSYFNPKSKKYEDTYTDRIALEVAETARLDTSELAQSAGLGTTGRELEELSGGLLANYTGPDVLEPQGPYRAPLPVWLGLAIALPLLWCGAYAWHRSLTVLRRNPAWQRARSAYRRASRRLDSIARGATNDGPDEIARTVAGYLADRLDLSAGELTPAEALYYAASLGVQPPLTDQLADLLGQCDQARFARRAGAVEPDILLQNARQILQQIEQTIGWNGRNRTGAVSLSRLLFFSLAVLLLPIDWTMARAQDSFDRVACLARADAAFERGVRATDLAAARQAFHEATQEYERLVADGVENGKLYYNLGNAYVRLGDVPQAILSYRLGQRLLPRDEQIAANLAFARSRVADRIEATDTSRLLRQLFVVHHAFSVRERMRGAAVAFLVAWAVLIARIFVPRRSLSVIGLLALAVSLGLATSIYAQTSDEAQHPLGVLASDEVLVRKGDGETYEPQFNRPLGRGLEFRVLNRRDEWLQIELPDGKTGWIRAEQAAVIEPRWQLFQPS
jgi:tetratricopeptide (TPR) repeat protein